jgi:hypothetical protein
MTVRRVNAEKAVTVNGEHKANLVFCPGMAHRPTSEELDRPFNRQEVAELRQRRSKLAPSRVIAEYRQVYKRCRIDGDRLPMAKSVLELVVIWKVWWEGVKGSWEESVMNSLR